MAAPYSAFDGLLLHATAGTIGGVAGIYVGSPLDIIKLRLQTSGSGATMAATARAILHGEGVRAFFRGALAVSAGQAPVNAIIFSTQNAVLRALHAGAGGVGEAALRDVYVAGAASGLAQAFALAPFEFIKIQQQAARGSGGGCAPSVAATARAIVRARGVGGLFRGLAATVLRDTPSLGLYFAVYEGAKRAGVRAAGSPAGGDAPAGVLLASGALAGALSWAFALPADVIKSRVQAAPLNAPAASLRIAAVAAAVAREGGSRAFFRGFVPCILRSLPVNAATFFVYEEALSILK